MNAKYVPASLSAKDKKKQIANLKKAQQAYKEGVYISRPQLSSFTTKGSSHIKKAKTIYGVSSINPSKELAKKTGCSLTTLKKIVEKGKGAYYSSGSRPNQTPSSWGLARLASAITGGKSAGVDFHLLKAGCKPSSKPVVLAKNKKK